MRQQLGLRRGGVGKPRLQHLRNVLVVLLPRTPEQRLIGRLLDQGMLEHIRGLWWHTALVEQFGLHQARQGLLERGLVERVRRPKELVGKCPPQDGRGQLCHILYYRQPIETRHQRS